MQSPTNANMRRRFVDAKAERKYLNLDKQIRIDAEINIL